MDAKTELFKSEHELQVAEVLLTWLRNQQPMFFQEAHATELAKQQRICKRLRARIEALQEQVENEQYLDRQWEFFKAPDSFF